MLRKTLFIFWGDREYKSKPMKISQRYRFFVVAALILIPLASIMAFALNATYSPVFKTVDNIFFESVDEMMPLVHLGNALHKVAMPPNDYLINGDPLERERWRSRVREVEMRFDMVRSRLHREEEKERLNALFVLWQQRKREGERILNSDIAGNEQALAQLMMRFDRGIYNIVARIDEMHAEIHALINVEYARAQQFKQNALMATVVVLIVSLVAGFIASIYLGRERQRLMMLSEQDPLTGIRNRRALDMKLHMMSQESSAMDDSFYSVLMMDIDHFKRINDEHGHHSGDDVLRHFAGLVEQNMRTGDFFARWGGEEFVLLLPDTEKSVALKIAERIRQAVHNTPAIGIDDSDILMTVSIGGSSWPEHGEEYGEVIRLADKALYAAKNSGRNCVVFA